MIRIFTDNNILISISIHDLKKRDYHFNDLLNIVVCHILDISCESCE